MFQTAVICHPVHYMAAVREDQLHGIARKLNNIVTELKASDGCGNTENQCASFLHDSQCTFDYFNSNIYINCLKLLYSQIWVKLIKSHLAKTTQLPFSAVKGAQFYRLLGFWGWG